MARSLVWVWSWAPVDLPRLHRRWTRAPPPESSGWSTQMRSSTRQVSLPSRTGLVGASVGSAMVVFTVTVIVTAVPVVSSRGPCGSKCRCSPAAAREPADQGPSGVVADAVDQLTSAIRAGLSLPEAVADLARRGPEPLRISLLSSMPNTGSGVPSGCTRRAARCIGGPGRRSRMCVVTYRT